MSPKHLFHHQEKIIAYQLTHWCLFCTSFKNVESPKPTTIKANAQVYIRSVHTSQLAEEKEYEKSSAGNFDVLKTPFISCQFCDASIDKMLTTKDFTIEKEISRSTPHQICQTCKGFLNEECQWQSSTRSDIILYHMSCSLGKNTDSAVTADLSFLELCQSGPCLRHVKRWTEQWLVS